jgi:hypothetical protein
LILITLNQTHFYSIDEFCGKIVSDLRKQAQASNNFAIFEKRKQGKNVILQHFPNAKKIDSLILTELASIRGKICIILVPMHFVACINFFYKGFTSSWDIFHENQLECNLEALGNLFAIFIIGWGGYDLKRQVKKYKNMYECKKNCYFSQMTNWYQTICNELSSNNVIFDGNCILSKSDISQIELQLANLLDWNWELSASGYFNVDLPLITSVYS